MTSRGDDQVHRWIALLLDRPASNRRAWIESEFPDDPHFRERLLAAVGEKDESAVSPARVDVAFSVPLQAPETVPRTIGRYTILREIGEGGMGRVFLARDPHVDRHVAIKLLREGFGTEEFRQRFWREARAAGQLHHINIVRIFDLDEQDGYPFIVMEYLSGRTLLDIIAAREPLPLDRRLAIVQGLCAGLACAHAAGLVHRDVKPANVMVGDDGVAKILDFGIAKPVARGDGAPVTSITIEQVVMGTPGYHAPEHLCGSPADARSDMFAAAVVAYELLTYGKPFGHVTAAVAQRALAGDITPMRTYASDVPVIVDAIVMKALSVSPQERFKDMAVMERRIAEARADLASAVAAIDVVGHEDVAAQSSRSFLWIGVAAAAAVVLLVLTGLSWTTNRHRELPAAAPQTATRIDDAGASHARGGRRPKDPKADSSRAARALQPGARASTARPAPKAASDASDPAKEPQPVPGDAAALLDARPQIGAAAPSSELASTPSTASDGLAARPADALALSDADGAAILKTLKALEAAFEQRSTPGLRAVVTSLTQQELALYERTFLEARSYVVRLIKPRLAPSSSTSVVVQCSITREVVLERGQSTRQAGRATLLLEKEQDTWIVASLRTPEWW